MATLLLIDDDRVVRAAVSEALSDRYECHTADRAEQALEFLEVQTCDVVLTDIAMPGLSGIELLRRVRELEPTTPVIVISGKLDAEEELLDLGAFEFIAKPFRFEEVENAILRAIAYRKTLEASVESSINE